jgi:hypothetical protein
VKLTQYELQSAVWVKLREHLERQLQDSRSRNDGDLNEIDTARLRGRIAVIKQILAFGEPTPEQAEPDA